MLRVGQVQPDKAQVSPAGANIVCCISNHERQHFLISRDTYRDKDTKRFCPNCRHDEIEKKCLSKNAGLYIMYLYDDIFYKHNVSLGTV